MRLIGLDYGRIRVGVALSDEAGHFSFPHSVWSTPEAGPKIVALAKKEGVGKIILGQSLDYSGKPNAVMKQIEKFKSELEKQTGIEVVLEPEFLTSAEAERIEGKHKMLDASAAALILKSYIDRTTLQS